MKGFLAGLVLSAALVYAWGHFSPDLPVQFKIHRFFGTEYNDKPASILGRHLEKNFIRPQSDTSKEDEPGLEFGDSVTQAKVTGAIEALNKCGYDARITTMAAENGKKLFIVSSRDLPADAAIFKDSWMWMQEPRFLAYHPTKHGRHRAER